MTAVAGQAVAAARRKRIEAERRVLADLRVQALQLRAQIGEEMFKLWRTHTLPPSSLDYLFEAIEKTMAEIAGQNERIERMSTLQVDGAPDQNAAGEVDNNDVLDMALPPPPLPSTPTILLDDEGQSCPSCGSKNSPGRRYCGECGSPLH